MKKIVFVLLWSLIYPLFADIFIEKTQVQAKIEENSVYLTLTIQIQKQGNQWESLDFLPKNIQILQQQGEAILKRERGRFVLYLQKEGKYTSSFELKLSLQKEQEQTFFQFPSTSGSIAEFILEVPSKDLQIQLDPLSFLLEQTVQGEKTTLKIIPSNQLEVRWQSVQAIQKLAPLVYAQNTTLIETLEGEIRYHENLQIQVVRGGMDTLNLIIPEKQKLFQLKGNDLKWWELRGNRLEIHFQKKIEKLAVLSLELHQLYSGGLPAQVSLQPVQIEEVSIQNGVIALEKGEILSQEIQLKDLEREDVESFRYLRKELMAAYQFRGKDPQLQVELKKRPPQIELTLHHNFHYAKETLAFQTFAHFLITEAKVGQLVLTVPKTMQIYSLKEAIPSLKRDVSSLFIPALRTWEQTGEEITLYLKEQRTGTISFFLEGQFVELPSTALPCITSPQTKAISGKLGISHDNDLKLLVEQSQELTQINASELPRELFSKAFQPKFGFSFGQKPFTLQIKTTSLKPYLTTNVQTLYRLSPEKTQFEAIYDLRLKDVGLFQLFIPLTPGLEITDVRSPETPIDFWERKENQLLVKFVREVKQGKLEIKGILSAQTSGTLQVFFPQDSQKNEGILVVDPDAEFLLTSTQIKELEEKPRSDSPFVVENQARVFKTTEKTASFQYSVSVRSPEMKGNLYSIYTFVSGYIVAQSEVQLQIEQAGIRKLTLTLPQKAGNLIITGPEILDFYPREKDYQIELKNKIRGPLTFFINYDIPYNVFGESNCILEGIDFPELKELKGFEGWKKSEIPIEVLLEGQQGYDVHPSPKAPKQTPSNRFTLVQDSFGIKERTRQIQLKIKGLDQTQIQEVQISDLNIRTEVNEEGKLTTRLTCRFNNTTRQFLRIRVDQKAVLWGTYILQSPSENGNNSREKMPQEHTKEKTPVKPTIGKNGEILVPIPKNVQDAELEMIFVDTLKKMGYLGDLDLMTPSIEDAQVEKLAWDLVVPKNYLLIEHKGPFELKPVHSSLLPDSLAVYLQREAVGAFKSFLPKFLLVGEKGAWITAFIGLLGLICFVLFYGYRYFGPDSFLILLARFFAFTLIGFVLYFTYQEEPALSFIIAGTLTFGWLLYRCRTQIVDALLMTQGPSRNTVFTLLCLFAITCILSAFLFPGLLRARSSKSGVFRDARRFQELSDSAAYDISSNDTVRHRTGKLESFGYDDGAPSSQAAQNYRPSPDNSPKNRIKAQLESTTESDEGDFDGDLRNEKKSNAPEKRRLTKMPKSPEENAPKTEEEQTYSRENKLVADKQEPEPDISETPSDFDANFSDSLSLGKEGRKGEKLDYAKDLKEGERDRFGLTDGTTPKPVIMDPAQKARELSAVHEIQKEIDLLEAKVQAGEMGNIGGLFYETYQKTNNQNFLVLQDEHAQLKGKLSELQRQIGQQIIVPGGDLNGQASDPASGGGKGGFFKPKDEAGESYQDGQQLLQQGQFQEAIKELNKTLVLNPNNPRALELLKEAEKRLEASQELAKTLQVTWDRAEVKLTHGELEEASKLLTEIQRQGAPFARNPKVKDLLQQAQDREKLLSERLGQLRNWKRMSRERIQQQIQDKFQVKLTGTEIDMEEFTCRYPQNPLVQGAIEKLLQQAKQDLQNLRKSILSANSFQQSLGMEGLSEQFARVKGGRSAGALPIPVNLPAENRIGFSFELTLTDKPESIKFVFMNRTISYFWQVLFMAILLGGLYGILCKKGLEASWLGFFATLLLLAGLQNIVDPEYLPYLKTGLYATALFLPVLIYQHFSKWLVGR